jgi:hypothetical protein
VSAHRHGRDPAPRDQHHLELCFREDGHVLFYPTTHDPEQLARRFAQLLRFLVEEPSAVACAAGWHQSEPEG